MLLCVQLLPECMWTVILYYHSVTCTQVMCSMCLYYTFHNRKSKRWSERRECRVECSTRLSGGFTGTGAGGHWASMWARRACLSAWLMFCPCVLYESLSISIPWVWGHCAVELVNQVFRKIGKYPSKSVRALPACAEHSQKQGAGLPTRKGNFGDM